MPEKLTAILMLFTAAFASSAAAHEPHSCPADFPDRPALADHVGQNKIVDGTLSLAQIIESGRNLFITAFNICDGQGRPATTGGGDARSAGQPEFIRTSSPESNSCSGCHAQPRAGGAGDFVANVFVMAQTLDPVTNSVSSNFSNERNTLGMFGSGAIEMLAREISVELRAQAHGLADGKHTLVSKGVEFEVVVEGDKIVASDGVDTDLIIKPFHQAGVVVSVREFSVNAFNHHHGMQAEERL